MSQLTNRVALVTGASRGIGREIARTLASRGARVAAAARTESSLLELASEMKADGFQEVLPLVMDVADGNSVRVGVEKIVKEWGAVEVLVNNAGITRDTLLMRMKEADWRAVMATNLDSVYYLTRQILPLMIRKRQGRIINIVSVVGQTGNPGQANYVASKAGVIGITKAIAREVASRGITVNAVAPGYIDTDMTAALSEKAREAMLGMIPLGRTGTPREVAESVAFLASDEAGYITGHVLNINGGMYM